MRGQHTMPDGRIMMSDGTIMSARDYQDGNLRPELAQLKSEAQHTTEADALSDLVDRDEPPQA
ncbi:MAG: hypothetical protein ACK4IA_00015 [Paracoccus hibiscisoli]|uniref:hypothetical protein n=1 Tax=Paracoccus hibiscisoli TaxID=2023261 RepID=UPI00391D2DDD